MDAKQAELNNDTAFVVGFALHLAAHDLIGVRQEQNNWRSTVSVCPSQ